MIRTRAVSRAGGVLVFVLPGVWVAAVLVSALLVPAGIELVPAVAVAPALACAGSGRRRCVLLSGMLAVGALVAVAVSRQEDSGGHRIGTAVTVVVVIAVCLWLADHKARLTAELGRTREIADAAQQALLRPLPQRIDGVAVAGEYLSASRDARVGGDLYEVLATPYGLRVVLGDVRGHGIDALGTVAALLGSFREAAHDEPDLTGLLARLDRTLGRHLRERSDAERSPAAASADQDTEEEFVTLLLLQIEDDGTVGVLNCGHPQPYRITAVQPADIPGGPQAELLEGGEPLPPLGLFDTGDGSAQVHRATLLPGEALFLHTDGVADARDASGVFFPLADALTVAARTALRCGSLCAASLVVEMRAAILRHTRGRITDDMALLVLHREAPRVPVQAGASQAATAVGAEAESRSGACLAGPVTAF
jgi:serine phosphatase RsbU (regulator of sigma subunit)